MNDSDNLKFMAVVAASNVLDKGSTPEQLVELAVKIYKLTKTTQFDEPANMVSSMAASAFGISK